MSKEELISLLVTEKAKRHEKTLQALEMYVNQVRDFSFYRKQRRVIDYSKMNVDQRRMYSYLKDYYLVEKIKEDCFDVVMKEKKLSSLNTTMIFYADVVSSDTKKCFISFLSLLIPVYSELVTSEGYYYYLLKEFNTIAGSIPGVSVEEIVQEYKQVIKDKGMVL